jgi:hypothetical protein
MHCTAWMVSVGLIAGARRLLRKRGAATSHH